MTASTHTLRRSCHFCRTRKIRCSGESICEACRERSHDCVYDAETARGRPKGSGVRTDSTDVMSSESGSPSPSFAGMQGTNIESTSPSMRRRTSESVYQSANGSSGQEEIVGNALRQMFAENFTALNFTTENMYQQKIASFSRTLPSDMNMLNQAAASSGDRRQHLDLEQGLYHVPQDLVSMLSTKFGNLGCQYIDEGGAKSCIQSLVNDTSTEMYDDTAFPASCNPLQDLDPRRASQMIDVWFSTHPLSPIVSKTLLLRSVRSKSYDEALFAAIMAGACIAHDGDETNASRTRALLQWAAASVEKRTVDQSFDAKLSIVQTLLLIGWDDLCHDRIRRAVCNIGYAGRIVATLGDHLVGEPLNSRSRVNGIDIREVEKELVLNCWWMSFMLTHWFFMQMDEQLPGKPNAAMPPDFPPLETSQSALVSLDEASDNVSTLHMQKQALKTMWPLSHVASVNAHIYALLPRDFPPSAEASNSVPWHERPLHQLRSLLDFRTTRDVSSISVHVVAILQASIGNLHREIKDAATQAVILTVHHTILIHMMFPWGSTSVNVTEQRLRQLLGSTQSLLRIFSQTSLANKQGRRGSATACSLLNASLPEIFVMGLDACGRAMERFYDQSQSTSDFESKILASNASAIAKLANQAYLATKSENLSSVTSLRPVKKRLKTFCNQMLCQYPFTADPAMHDPASSSMPATQAPMQPSQSMPRRPARTQSSPTHVPEAQTHIHNPAMYASQNPVPQRPQMRPLQRQSQGSSSMSDASMSAMSSRSQSIVPDSASSNRSRGGSMARSTSRQPSMASTAPTDFSRDFDLSALDENADWSAMNNELFNFSGSFDGTFSADMTGFEDFMLNASCPTTTQGGYVSAAGSASDFGDLLANPSNLMISSDPFQAVLETMGGAETVMPERGPRDGRATKRPRS